MTEYLTDVAALRDRLTEIWQHELLLATPDPDVDFLEVNGSSLTAVRIAAHIEQATGIEVALEDIYDLGSPSALARALVDRAA